MDHRHALGDVERAVGLEAPGVEADAEVVGEGVVAGEIEVDQPGKPIAEEEHVVGEEIGVDHAARQVRTARSPATRRARPPSHRARPGETSSARAWRPRTAAGQPSMRQRVGPAQREVRARLVHARQRLADLAAMTGLRPANPQAVEKGDDRGGAAGEAPERLAVARAHRLRAGDAARGQMLHQADEERQVVLVHPLFIERQDELAGFGVQQELEFSTPSAMPLNELTRPEIVAREDCEVVSVLFETQREHVCFCIECIVKKFLNHLNIEQSLRGHISYQAWVRVEI